MMPFSKKGQNPWAVQRHEEIETFWASYSDLMAGLLMIFALTTVITLLDIGKRLVEPTHLVKEWEQVVDDICHDRNLSEIENVEVDCNTGALVISEKSLRFGFGRTELGQEAEAILRQAVPKYLEIIYRYPQFLERIEVVEISGHTDRADTRNANPFISRERAGQVLSFLLNEPAMKPYMDLLKKKAITAGYSDTRFPVGCVDERCAEARRVEITIRLSETDVLRDFLNILRQIIK
ncbi:MAG: OmpA family protein [Desulfobacterales bacterium]|nr:OmpA family protein [Desulfobacterales bacterium]MDD4073020.1 OmpA family protein [Desulfobacterales bacterium]MDD4392014.1 OmpA family protein [Desulfobacterales bacterium]